MFGKNLRMAHILNGSTQRTCIVPIDHGTTLGPVPGLVDVKETIHNILEGGADAIILHKGLLRMVSQCPELVKGTYLLHLHVSTILGPDPNHKVLVATVEEGVKLGAQGISVHVNIGTGKESEMISDLGVVSKACMEWGMPLLAMMYSQKDRLNADQIAHAARLGEELGADIVKVDYPGSVSDMEKVVRGVRIPVVIAGGSKKDDMAEFLSVIRDGLNAGAAGVSIGRNVFQYKNQKLITQLISQLVHNHISLEGAWERLQYDKSL